MNTGSRNTNMKLGLGALLVLAITLGAGSASAKGLVVADGELAPAAHAALVSSIKEARAASPGAFLEVEQIASRAGVLDAEARRPGVPLTLHFKDLGPRALMPMLEMLALDARVPSTLTPSAQTALRLGLIEAVGILRDARAIPVLGTVAKSARDVSTTHAAADALGRIGTDDAHHALVEALDVAAGRAGSGLVSIERERAILGGLGVSRRLDATRILVKRLDANADETTARVVAKALSAAGNAWAWKTEPARGDEAQVRELATRALLRIYVGYRAEARQAAANGVLVVDAPNASALIAEARRGASSDLAPALDDLASRLARNPSR